jgi:hypothetical protein
LKRVHYDTYAITRLSFARRCLKYAIANAAAPEISSLPEEIRQVDNKNIENVTAVPTQIMRMSLTCIIRENRYAAGVVNKKASAIGVSAAITELYLTGPLFVAALIVSGVWIKTKPMAPSAATPTAPHLIPITNDAMLISDVMIDHFISSPPRPWLVKSHGALP